MKTKIMKLKDGRVVRVIDDGNGKVVRDAWTGQYLTRVWRFKSRWASMESNAKWESLAQAIGCSVAGREFRDWAAKGAR